MNHDEEILIRRIASGHSDDYRRLIARYAQPLMVFVGRIVHRQEDAEDVVQDALVSAFEHLADYDAARASFATWLNSIAYHEALHHLRRRPPAFVEVDEAMLVGIPDELPDTTTAEQLDEAIRKLSPEDQTLLQLYYFDQRPLHEIAFILKGADDHLEREASRLSTCLQRIRQRLRIILSKNRE